MSDSTGGKTRPVRWSEIFSRSSIGPYCYFVKGTQRSHDTGGTEPLQHEVFRRILDVCAAYNLTSWDRFDGGPGARCSFVQIFAFLDGGMLSVDSDSFWQRHGAWVFGDDAMRFLCFELDVVPPARAGHSQLLRTREELRREIDRQVRHDGFLVRRRIEEARKALDTFIVDLREVVRGLSLNVESDAADGSEDVS